MQNMALLKKRPEVTSGGFSGATARHLEELLMRERAKNTTLMQQMNQSQSAGGQSSLEAQIKQTVLAEDMLMEANKSVARLEKSETALKAENARLKFELDGLKVIP